MFDFDVYLKTNGTRVLQGRVIAPNGFQAVRAYLKAAGLKASVHRYTALRATIN